MKVFAAVGGLLLPMLVPLVGVCSGQQPVSVACSHHNFRAIAKRALFYRDEFVGPDELFLGTGCRAVQVRPDELEFDYPVSLCGIKMQVFFDRTVFHSWLTYKPRSRFISAELHLQCIVPSSYASPDDTERNSVFFQHPPAQHWFLVRYRNCMSCGYAHFKDNWELMVEQKELKDEHHSWLFEFMSSEKKDFYMLATGQAIPRDTSSKCKK